MPGTVTYFEAHQVDQQRRQAWKAWMDQVPQDTPEGWSKSPADLTALIAAFPALRLKEGYTLRAYQFRARNDGNGVVWAIPATAPFPEPKDTGLHHQPHPPDALDSIVEAVEGDQTPWSYLSASLFCREAGEFGAVGHGVDWLAFTVLSADPWNTRVKQNYLGPIQGPSGEPEDWTWTEARPSDWRPVVRDEGEEVVVEFLTFCGLGSQRITRHIDRYPRGSYRFTPTVERIAEGPAGYVL